MNVFRTSKDEPRAPLTDEAAAGALSPPVGDEPADVVVPPVVAETPAVVSEPPAAAPRAAEGETFIGPRGGNRRGIESVFVRLVATSGIVGICVRAGRDPRHPGRRVLGRRSRGLAGQRRARGDPLVVSHPLI